MGITGGRHEQLSRRLASRCRDCHARRRDRHLHRRFRQSVRGAVRPAPRAACTTPAYANPNDDGAELRADLKRQIVSFPTNEAPGTIIIDTPNPYLYLSAPAAIRYGVGVGREGYTWWAPKRQRKAEWPDWRPPAEMIARQKICRASWPAARAIRSARAPLSRQLGVPHPRHQRPIDHRRALSSGCIRMLNEDVIDLYERVQIGTKVVVLPMGERRAASSIGSIY